VGFDQNIRKDSAMTGVPSFVGLLALLPGAVAFAGLVTGLVLLIIGLAKHRRGLWVAGLICMIICLLILLAVAALAAVLYFRVGPR